MKRRQKADVLQGTLDLLILKTLLSGPMHGFGITQRLDQMSKGVFCVNPGTLFPVLYRLEDEGRIEGYWGTSENNRRAKYYKLTAAGRRYLEEKQKYWITVSLAIAEILEG